MYLFTTYEHSVRFDVNREATLDNAGGFRLLPGSPPQLCPYAGKEFRCTERFGHVIISPTIERGNLSCFLLADGGVR